MSLQSDVINRRQFIHLSTMAGAGLVLYGCDKKRAIHGIYLKPVQRIGKIKLLNLAHAPIDEAIWYEATEIADGLEYKIKSGSFMNARYLVTDLFLAGNALTSFKLSLHEKNNGPVFSLGFNILNQCSARVRFPLAELDLTHWRLKREGAWLNAICEGERVNLAEVDRITVTVARKSTKPVRWCMTSLIITNDDVTTIDRPILPNGRLLDELGQSTLHEWHGKSRSVDYVIKRIDLQHKNRTDVSLPQFWTRWGGWSAKRFNATGYFHTHRDRRRWWLVDPAGRAFWSTGLNCVRIDTEAYIEGLESALTWKPDPAGPFHDIYSDNNTTINYLKANLIRAFGPDEWHHKWVEIAFAELKRIGFNTVGNWSDWDVASREQVPYVRQLSFKPARTRNIYRDFPDVFHPDFKPDVKEYAQQLKQTALDKAFIGYFLMNEPRWGFSEELPAVGMLYNTPTCETRKQLAKHLQQKYEDKSKLSEAWKIETSFEQIAAGVWKKQLTEAAITDLREFSQLMVQRFFKLLSYECRQVDSNHLNLGIRFHTIPATWLLEGMRFFDVFSLNCYKQRIPRDKIKEISTKLEMPVIITEWHFGALDVGLPGSGRGHVRNQRERGMAYRSYIENAAANRYCVGAHWHAMYDQSALGHADGENYNIGFFDVCNNRYAALARAARKSHERIYSIAAGMLAPYQFKPQYLPAVF